MRSALTHMSPERETMPPDKENEKVSVFSSKLAERLQINPAFHITTQIKSDREIEIKATKALKSQTDKFKTDDINILYRKINQNARFKKATIPIERTNHVRINDQNRYLNLGLSNMYNT